MAELKNQRREKFAQALFAGKSQRVAYREAYPTSENWKDATVDNTAYKLAKTDEIIARLAELQNATATPLILDRQGRMIILSGMATDEKLSAKPRMMAIDLLNKMTSEYLEKKQIEAIVNTPIEDAASRIKAIIAEVKDS